MLKLYAAQFYRVVCLLFLLLSWSGPAAWAQQAGTEVSGRVSAAKIGPLPGVTVLVKGTAIGTSTDVEGNFTLKVPAGTDVLLVSYVGYTTQTVTLGGRSRVEVTLAENTQALTDVVVVGYGTQRRTEVTGAIASVKAEEITRTPIANVGQGLQGRAAGVQITQNSAAPGGSISVRVRGTNSINGTSEPLYVVDGIQISNTAGINEISPLSTINPSDIESVEVLKDASATAIYGSLGANGVVLITTKRGKNGPTHVSYDGYYGVQRVNKKLGVLDATQFAQLENEIYQPTVVYANPASLGTGTKWQDLIFRDAKIQNHQLTIAGGADKTQLALSLNYFNQDGIIRNSSFDRYSVRLNLDHRLNDRIKIGTSLLTSYAVNKGIPQAPTSPDFTVTTGVLAAALAAPPTLQPYDATGAVLPFGDQLDGRYREVVNPLGLLQILNQTAVRRSLANVFGDVLLADGLTYRVSFSADLQSSLNDYYSPRSIVNKADLSASSGSAAKTNTDNTVLLHESTLTYAKTLADKHALKLTVGISNRGTFYNTSKATATGFPNDVTSDEALQLGVSQGVSSNRYKTRLDSYLGRLNYVLKGRYLLEVLARVDGGSVFGANNKYGFFPAASAGWRLIEEDFMQHQKLVSDLKLRASYGVAANGAAIGPYQSLSLSSPGLVNNYQLDHTYTTGASPNGLPNPYLRWERSYQGNIGLDLAILENRFTFTADVYSKKTKDLLFVRPLPLSSGYPSYTGNFAEVQNRGLELAANGRILDGDFRWNVNGNISFNRNKLVALQGAQSEYVINNYSVLQVGQPLGILKTYVFDGVYQTGEAVLPGSGSRVGGVKVRDLNNDGQITADDQAITGNANPNFTYGFSTDLSYKAFDFSLFASGVQGNQVYNLLRYSFENPLGQRNQFAGVANRFSTTNPSNEYISGAQGGRVPFSNRFVEDGSFLRLRNITLGYTLPAIKGLYKARVYVSANNLYTFTKYSGYDPEVNIFAGSNTQLGVDNGVYPVAKSVLGGVQVTF